MRLTGIALISVPGFHCVSPVSSQSALLPVFGGSEEDQRVQILVSSRFPIEHSQKSGVFVWQFT